MSENLVLDAFHSCLCARSLPFRFMSYLAWTCIEVVHLCITPTLLSLELSAPAFVHTSDASQLGAVGLEQQA